jgi:sugar lactone lactonase YvrE
MLPRPLWNRYFFVFALLLSGGLLTSAAQQSGKVQSGALPVALARVSLYSAGAFAPALLGQARTDITGSFTIPFSQPADPNAVLYLIGDGGSVVSPGAEPAQNSAIRLALVLGPNAIPTGVVINERTTVATAYAMAQFISGAQIAGKSPGLQNAAATLLNLVDPTTGRVGSVLGDAPNGLLSSTMREFNSLANLLASCVRAGSPSSATCNALFTHATPPGAATPQNTLAAAVQIAHNPWLNPSELFQQAQALTPYLPALGAAPDAWTLAILYNGNGHEFDGPGNMAFDENGNVWITNNYAYNASPLVSVCGGTQVLKLTPTGLDAPGAPYSGGGVYGAGFGIAVDPSGNAWFGDFGFEGVPTPDDCPAAPPFLTVSEFASDGTALSTPNGFTQGNTNQPQGMAADPQGNIWIANCGNDSVTEYPGGDATTGTPPNFHNIGLLRPFGLAVDGQGNVWIASSGNDRVVGLAPDGTPLPGSPFMGGHLRAPLGVAVDSMDNVWIADSAAIRLPCGGTVGRPIFGETPSVTMLTRTARGAKLQGFTGGGIVAPWGIAVDGDDNVWVANFGGRTLSEFCGAQPAHCPAGLDTGDPISPPTGYTSDALTRNTGVAIDPSGNVWLANNWLELPPQTNPGGRAMVVFIGLAAPVKTPLNGAPQKP